MDKRANLRQHFQSEANKAELGKQHAKRTAQLNDFENTVVDGFNALIKFIDGKTTKTEVVNQLKSISTPDVDKVVTAVSKLDKDVLANKLDLKPLVAQLTAINRHVSLIPKEHPEKPEPTESVKVTNLSEVKLDTSAVEKAIKELKLDVKAPIINTETTDLTPVQDILLDLVKAFKNQKPVEIPKFPEIPSTDLTKVEKKLDLSNKHLKAIVDKPVGGGGGGGGNGTPYIDATGKPVNVELETDGSIPVTVLAGGAGGSGYSKPTDSYTLIQFDDTSTPTTYEYYAYMDKDANWYVKRTDVTTNLNEYTAPVATSYTTGWTNRASLTFLTYGGAF